MKKSTKAILGTLGAAAGAAALTLGTGELLYQCMLTFKGLTFVQSKRLKDPKLMDRLKPTDFSAEIPRWFDEKNHSYVHSTNCFGELTTAECIDDFPENKRWAIICHGYTADPHSMARYAKFYHQKGFNMVLPCMRGHQNGADTKISMGWLDRFDIIGWVYYILHRCPDAQIVLHGESMGAGAVMMTCGEQLPPNVVCAVEDCGFTSVWDEFSYQIGEMVHLPVFPFLYAGQFMTKLHGGIDYKEASAVEQLKKAKTPMLFLHGEADDFVPFEMVFQNYNAFDGEKDIMTIPEAAHACSVTTNPELYWAKVWEFVGKYVDLEA